MRFALFLLFPFCLPPLPQPTAAAAWWGHVETLAADAMEGRAAGSEGHRRASDYVAARFARYGLQPAGENGTYFQAVRLEERRILPGATRAALDGAPLAIPGDIYLPRCGRTAAGERSTRRSSSSATACICPRPAMTISPESTCAARSRW